MTRYFLFNNGNRAGNYGVGTYVKQMIDCLNEVSLQCELNLVDIYSDVVEFTLCKESNGMMHYLVPKPQRRTSLYYKYIIFLLESYVGIDESVVFHFNNDKLFDLMRLLKVKFPKCHIVYTVHYLDWCFAIKGNVTRFKKILAERCEYDDERVVVRDCFSKDKRLFMFCDEIIVLSKFAYELLRMDYGVRESKLHLIYNGMKEGQCFEEYIEGYVQPQEILFVGRLDEIKGVEFTIRAFKKVCMVMDNVRLTLVGDGDFRHYLAFCDGVWEKVTFTGKISNEKLKNLYNRATIGVLPSFHEQCSYSAIEMMVYGVPLIATDSTGLREMMDKTPENMLRINESCFNAEEFVDSFANIMLELLSDGNRRKKTSQNLQSLFRERYSMNCMRTSMGKFLDGVKCGWPGISVDFLPYLDKEMARLINERPLIDMDSIGMTGIGCYLWWRIKKLEDQPDFEEQVVSAKLQEYMIYYIDWFYDIITNEKEQAFPPTFDVLWLNWLFGNLMTSGFYKTRVYRIKELLRLRKDIEFQKIVMLEDDEIVKTALMIYNSNFI